MNSQFARRWPHVIVWVLVLAACSAVIAVSEHIDHEERTEFNQNVQRNLQNLAHLSAEHATRTLQSTDSVLRLLQVWSGLPATQRPALRQITGSLGLTQQVYNQVGIIDSDGMYHHSSLPNAPLINLSDREHFKVHRDAAADQLYISRTVTGRATGKPSIQLTRRLTDTQNRFAGVAVVSVNAEYFNRFYDQLALGKTGIAALVGTDGYIRARRTTNHNHLDASIASSPAFGLLARGESSGSYVYRSPVDGIERHFAFRKVPNLPVIVTVGFGLDEIRADLEQHQHMDMTLTGLVVVLLLSLGTLFSWWYQREQRQRAALAQAHEEAQTERQLLINLTDQVPGELFQFRVYPDGRSCFPWTSRHFREFYQLTAEQLQQDATPVFQYQHPDDKARIAQSIAHAVRTLEPWHLEYRLVLPGVGVVWRLGHSQPQRLPDGSTLCHGFIKDITARKVGEAELRIAATAFESIEAMEVADAHARILRVNPAFVAMYGYSDAELVGSNVRLMSSGRHDAGFYRAMWGTLQRDGAWAGEIWNRRKSGEIFPVWLTITAVRDASGLVTHYVGIHTDLTERKETEDAMRRLAFFDPLTQLPNRRLLEDRLEQARVASARSGDLGAVLFLDLDKFKELNDTRGHDAGDQLLLQIAQRLRDCVREADTVARLGGDEFVLVLTDLSPDANDASQLVALVAEKILVALGQPYDLNGVVHTCTVSVGVAMIDGKTASVSELLRQADAAMYQAKRTGAGQPAFSDSTQAPPADSAP